MTEANVAADFFQELFLQTPCRRSVKEAPEHDKRRCATTHEVKSHGTWVSPEFCETFRKGWELGYIMPHLACYLAEHRGLHIFGWQEWGLQPIKVRNPAIMDDAAGFYASSLLIFSLMPKLCCFILYSRGSQSLSVKDEAKVVACSTGW